MKAVHKFILATTTAVLLAVPAHAEELVLRGASYLPLETAFGKPFRIFADHVNEIGKGVLQISPMGPEAMPATEQPNALRSGLIDMAAMPPGTYKSVVPESNVQDLSNLTLAEMRETGAYDALKDLTRQKLNAEIITTFGETVPHHLYLTREIDSAEDLKGLRVRGQPIFGPFFTSLGMSMIAVPVPETYTALERGVVQGYGYPFWGIQDFGWDKMTKYRIDPGFYSGPLNIMVNSARYASLTDEQRKILDDAVVWFEQEMVRYAEEQDKVNQAAQAAAGIKAIDMGPEWRVNAANLYWEELAKTNPDTVPALRAKLQK